MLKRLAVFLSLLFVTGCAASTATLVDEALSSGDWRAVDARLDAGQKRVARRGPVCPAGYSAMCVSDSGDVSCRCAESADFRYELSGIIR